MVNGITHFALISVGANFLSTSDGSDYDHSGASKLEKSRSGNVGSKSHLSAHKMELLREETVTGSLSVPLQMPHSRQSDDAGAGWSRRLRQPSHEHTASAWSGRVLCILFPPDGVRSTSSHPIKEQRLELVFFSIIGIFGSASQRRGLIITFLVMGIHAVTMIAPMAIVYSSFDIHFYKVAFHLYHMCVVRMGRFRVQKECWGACDWHLLSASLPKNSRCQILCGDEIEENRRRLNPS